MSTLFATFLLFLTPLFLKVAKVAKGAKWQSDKK
jgi:hypothetical protein